MKNIIFIEGISGVGKTTSVSLLKNKLCELGYKTSYHLEGDPDSPLDLCWVSYLAELEYKKILSSYPEFADELSKNIVFQSDYVLLRYQTGRTALYSTELHEKLHQQEFCYNPTNTVQLSKFTDVFLDLWKRFAASDETDCDYAIFDGSLVSHMTNDLIRNYNAREDELVKHLEGLLQTIHHLNPIIFYLSSDNVSERLIKARISREQTPLTNEQIAFWQRRKEMDISILPNLSVHAQIIDISNENWDFAISEMLSQIV